jgi:hypothetical protein
MPGPIAIALIVALVVALWSGFTFLLAALGGWRRLAETYPALDDPAGRSHSFESARIGRIDYENCLTLHATPRGLRLAAGFLFRVGHPPLFIPWEAFHDPRPSGRLEKDSVVYLIGMPPIAKIELAKWVFEGRGGGG